MNMERQNEVNNHDEMELYKNKGSLFYTELNKLNSIK